MFTSLERIGQDFRYAIRTLRKSRGFTLLAVATLALGIGATTAIFTVVHSILLRPLPFPEPERLVMIWERPPKRDRRNPAAMYNSLAWKERNRRFEAMSAFHQIPMNLLGGDEPVQITGTAVTAEFFRVLAIPPLLGRIFAADEDVPGCSSCRDSDLRALATALRRASGHCWDSASPSTPRIVRTTGDPLSLVAAVKEQIRQVDPDQGVAEVQTMEQLVADSIARPRLQAFLLSSFGFLALTLACIGIFGVVWYSVGQRTREFGIRLSLRSLPGSIFEMVFREGFRLAVLGLAIGLAAAFALTRYVKILLYEVEPTDPATFAAVSALVLLVAAAAGYFPASRATRVDPAVVLRDG